MAKSKFSIEEKYEILKAYEKGELTLREFLQRHQISERTLYTWREKYKQYGLAGLDRSNGWKHNSEELKLAAVRDALSGEYSLIELTHKYEISSHSLQQGWIKLYNGHRELKGTSKGRNQSMTKGRKTTVEERIEIANYCIKNQKDYQRAAEVYNVSYQQVYQWVLIFTPIIILTFEGSPKRFHWSVIYTSTNS
ncbi:helix-turn-helix domain-containing protein [Bacillus pinisoli]|uniref:helix-turn-helix domain-containing protein n=1 Tax=Bacillus pinisoli TaxID=2901866 RepID=UPI001FF5538A|nr:helix-turn-helix domain-containing protein [Bacillus pinisoli]